MQPLHHHGERGRDARYFNAKIPVNFNLRTDDPYPGAQGMVAREEGGERILQSMTWGLPLPLKSRLVRRPLLSKTTSPQSGRGMLQA